MKQRFRELIKTNRWLKCVPNSLTLCNSLCGFAAILYTLRAYERFYNSSNALSVFATSAVLICCAMIFDAFDGFAARLFNAASMHGIQMDSLADMVTFGVAPATLVAIMTHSLRDWDLNRTQEIWTLPLFQYNFKTEYSFNYTMAFTAYLLAMLPMLIIYCMGQKYIVKGLTAGSVKG